MGASSFQIMIHAKNNKEFSKAFHAEAMEDRYECGNDAYSGTIGQKVSFQMLSKTPVDAATLRGLQEKHEGDKWGDAMACPVAEEKAFGKSKTKTVKVECEKGWEALEKVRAMYPEYTVITETNATKVRDPKWSLEKVVFQKGWRVSWGFGKETLFEKKGAAVKGYKELLLKGEKATLTYQDTKFQRVLKRQAQWSLTVVLQKYKSTGKVSHYAVWGWAAE